MAICEQKLGNIYILIEDGRIAEQGCHEALMVQNGKYAQMYRMQSGLADE